MRFFVDAVHRRMFYRTLLFIFVASVLLGCAPKKLPPLIFPQSLYPADTYPLHASMDGVIVAIVPHSPGQSMYVDPRKPSLVPDDVPLNILEAGIFPIRVIITNRRDGELVIEPSQIFCLNDDTPYKTYRPKQAVNMVVKSRTFRRAVKGTRVGPLLKSIFGGELLFSAATASVGGAVSGGITGGVGGAAKGVTKKVLARATQYEDALAKLLHDQAETSALRPHILMPGFTTDGIVYCPSTIAVRAVRLTIYDRTNEEPLQILCALPAPTEPMVLPEEE